MRLAAIFMATLLATGAAQAADPSVWLRGIYDNYRRAENQPDLLPGSDEDLLVAHASRRFAALLNRNLNCEKKSHEICALDWDFIIDGQAWELSHVQVGALQAQGARASVTATFDNLKVSHRAVFAFVREDGAWKLDDVVSGPLGKPANDIAKVLSGFKLY